MNSSIKLALVLGFLVGSPLITFATHIRAGDLTMEILPNQGARTVRATVTIYLDRGPGSIDPDDATIFFGDGTEVIVPFARGNGRSDIVYYIAEHTYQSDGYYQISFREENRNRNVVNISGSVESPFVLTSSLLVSTGITAFNNPPVIQNTAFEATAKGFSYIHNAAAFDPDGDSLAYRLTVPLRGEPDVPVAGYQTPGSQLFTSDGENPGTFFGIDPVTGDLIWDSPDSIGLFNVAFIIEEYRNGRLLSETNRDIQIRVFDGKQAPPVIDSIPNICVLVGDTIDVTFVARDPDSIGVDINPAIDTTIDRFSNIQITKTTNRVQNNSRFSEVRLNFKWIPACNAIRKEAYDFLIRADDQAPPEFNSSNFLTTLFNWKVKVSAPPVQNIRAANIDSLRRSINLEWDAYSCYEQATQYRIYRSIGSGMLEKDTCNPGVDPFSGYQVIGEIPVSQVIGGIEQEVRQFRDPQIPLGVKVCYRVVAVFADGGESLVSDEACFFIPSPAPLLYNVSVQNSDGNNGANFIRWTPSPNVPISTIKQYRVLRRSGETNYIPISPILNETDTTFIDQPIDNQSIQYTYAIQLIQDNIATDTSFPAQTYQLEAVSEVDRIQLNWLALTPWTDRTVLKHYVYRKVANLAVEFTLIDSVNVSSSGMQYIDSGNGLPGDTLDVNQIYSYKVLAVGQYDADFGLPDKSVVEFLRSGEVGNLENFSQTLNVGVLDEDPPCPPVLSVDFYVGINEDLRFSQVIPGEPSEQCSEELVSNYLTWEDPRDAECDIDIAFYEIRFTQNFSGELIGDSTVDDLQFEDMVLLDLVTENFYFHNNLPSYGAIYSIVAVDDNDNRSEPSNFVAKNDVIALELPSAFTPYNQDGINDTFTSKSCPYRILGYTFSVYNRYNTLVYSKKIEEGEPFDYINWDGRDNSGQLLEPGTYLFLFDGEFANLNPQERSNKFRGTVELIR